MKHIKNKTQINIRSFRDERERQRGDVFFTDGVQFVGPMVYKQENADGLEHVLLLLLQRHAGGSKCKQKHQEQAGKREQKQKTKKQKQKKKQAPGRA